jgi:hypothetical protein
VRRVRLRHAPKLECARILAMRCRLVGRFSQSAPELIR